MEAAEWIVINFLDNGEEPQRQEGLLLYARRTTLEGMTGLIARGRLIRVIVGRAMTGEIARAVSGAGVDLPARPGE